MALAKKPVSVAERWLAPGRLSTVEATADDKQLMQLIESVLADEPVRALLPV